MCYNNSSQRCHLSIFQTPEVDTGSKVGASSTGVAPSEASSPVGVDLDDEPSAEKDLTPETKEEADDPNGTAEDEVDEEVLK